MSKVIFEQFDGGLQRGWTGISTSNRAFKNQKKNGIAAGVVNPFIAEGVLVPGVGSRTSATNESELASGVNPITGVLAVGDGTASSTAGSVYVCHEDDLHIMTPAGTFTTSQWPLTLSTAGNHSGQTLMIDDIVDYQINGVRKQLVFFRDSAAYLTTGGANSSNCWDAAYYSGIYGGDAQTVTMTQANPCVVTLANHRLSAGDTVKFSTTGTLPGGIAAGTIFYVSSTDLTQNTFKISATKGSGTFDASGGSAQSGTHSIHPGLQTDGMSAATNYSTNMIDFKKPILACVSDNGYLYFGNGSLIHKFDGTTAGGSNGTITGSVVTFSSNREIVDMVDGLGKIWVLTRPRTKGDYATSPYPYSGNDFEQQCSVVIWNRISTQVGIEDNLVITGCVDVYGIYIFDGVPYVWSKAPGGKNQLRMYNGKTFDVVADLGTEYQGIPASVGQNAVAQYENGFLWQDFQGRVFWHGSLNPQNGVAKATYLISTNASATSPLAGGLITAGSTDGNLIWTGYVASTTPKFAYFNPTSQSETSVSTTIYTSPIELPKLSTIEGVTIFFNELASDNSGTTTVKIYNSWAKTTGSNYVVTKYIDHDVDIPRGWVYFPLAMENSNLVQLSFAITSGIALSKLPQITRIEVDYSTTTKKK